ncbi:MAG: tRNA pseudouridine(55) synthase TruB [Bryobacteraceae bacterium]|nr:tRNA pseudouridine(55) synthase TruB [Bryobacteraceae bacterium]
MDGAIVLDKPAGWTSHDAVAKVRRATRSPKVGHLGTLDPMATGVLPLVIGKATRLAQFFSSDHKVYEATVRFGFATTTYDREGEPLSEPSPIRLEPALLETWLSRYRGPIQQVPPPVSAKKIGGVPAYELARRQQPVELAPVPVTIRRLEVRALREDEVDLVVECSAGTYIRSIAHDLGREAGTGAHLTALRRTESGPFRLAQAVTMPELIERANSGRIPEILVPAAALLPAVPAQEVNELVVMQIRQGRDFRVSPFHHPRGVRLVKAVDQAGELVCIGEAVLPHLFHPIVVF